LPDVQDTDENYDSKDEIDDDEGEDNDYDSKEE
jgi:hypothetical protein